MARGELMKKLLASYGRDDQFRAVAEQIIVEEEQKNNRVLARALRRTLDNAVQGNAELKAPKVLAPLIRFPDAASEFIEKIEPSRTHKDITLAPANVRVFRGLMEEFRRSDEFVGRVCRFVRSFCFAVHRDVEKRFVRKFLRSNSACHFTW
ncbi:Cell division protein FtsH [Candidatus Burkholderia humilis]|nr:Cell division protein FtsH [Candidatus Burkholderia humilis]